MRYIIITSLFLSSCQTSKNLAVNSYFIVKEQRGEYVKVESPSTENAPYKQSFVIHWPENVTKGDTLYIENR